MVGFDSFILGISAMGVASQNEFILDREATAAKYTPGAFRDENAPAGSVPAYGAYTVTQPPYPQPYPPPAPYYPPAMPAASIPGGSAAMPTEASEEEVQIVRKAPEGLLGLPTWAWIAGGSALALALLGGVGLFVMTRRH
jgi:hypothetical protein